MDSHRTFCVHSHFPLHISRRWALATAGVGSWYEAEGLDLIAPEFISVGIDGTVYFDSAKLHFYAEHTCNWDLLAAIDTDEYLEGDLPYYVLMTMFSEMESFSLDLDTTAIVRIRPEFGGHVNRVDGIRFNVEAQTIELRWEGTQDWFSVTECTNDRDSLRALIVNVAFSMSRGLWSLTDAA